MFTSSVDASGDGAVSSEMIYEKRFGARNQLEFAVPVSFLHNGTEWAGGVGDFVVGYKRVLAHSSRSGIDSAASRASSSFPRVTATRTSAPASPRSKPSAAFGQLLPSSSFLQVQVGAELPTDTEKAPQAVYLADGGGQDASPRTAASAACWTPMVEILADRDLETGAKTNWDVVPQMQVTLNKRQHVRVNVGVRQPVNNTERSDRRRSCSTCFGTSSTEACARAGRANA